MRAALPGSLLDRRDDRLLGLVRVGRGGTAAVAATLRALLAARTVTAGLSGVCVAVDAYPAAFEEARHALGGAAVVDISGPVLEYEALGAFKYLLRIAEEATTRDVTVQAVGRLAAYDDARQTHLLPTLEEFLRRHGSISATSEALYVHPNTLRQRLRRIAEVADIDLRRDDWLMIEIAVKLVRLRESGGE